MPWRRVYLSSYPTPTNAPLGLDLAHLDRKVLNKICIQCQLHDRLSLLQQPLGQSSIRCCPYLFCENSVEMKKSADDVHDFSGHWAMNLPEGKNIPPLPPRRGPSKPRGYKSIHCSEYNEAASSRLSRTSSEVAEEIKGKTDEIIGLLRDNGRG